MRRAKKKFCAKGDYHPRADPNRFPREGEPWRKRTTKAVGRHKRSPTTIPDRQDVNSP